LTLALLLDEVVDADHHLDHLKRFVKILVVGDAREEGTVPVLRKPLLLHQPEIIDPAAPKRSI
jgi:hypothetical protein